MSENWPRVGLGVCIIKDSKVLLGQRLNAHGDGSWCFPGGHLEFGETWEECAIREVTEETGLTIKNPVFVTCTNDIFEEENKHYITLYLKAAWISGEPQVLEPEKMVKWQWFNWEKLPSPLFIPMQHLVETGFKP
jgi:8-oxo-dGTP diphosphatase